MATSSVHIMDHVIERDERGHDREVDLSIINHERAYVRRGLDPHQMEEVRKIVRQELGIDLAPLAVITLDGIVLGDDDAA